MVSEIDKINSQIHYHRAEIRKLKEQKERLMVVKERQKFEEQYCLCPSEYHSSNDELIRIDTWYSLGGEYLQTIHRCPFCKKEYPYPVPMA